MYITMLGRQPAIGMAELERVFGAVRWFSHDSALVDSDHLDIQRLGGVVKAGRVIAELKGTDWRKTSMQLVKLYGDKWASFDGKLTLGISVYGFKVSPRDVQRTGLILKSQLKNSGVSLRLIPNEQSILSTATSHHNKLGLANNKVELLVIKGHGGNVVIAESTGSQNITALARRDQERPARDAFVGMLPPKLALTMLNLAVGNSERAPAPFFEGDVPSTASQAPQADQESPVERPLRKNGADARDHHTPFILDPFCGTGVVPQEALLLGYTVSGSDLNPKMVDYTQRNLEWLKQRYTSGSVRRIREGDATNYVWDEARDIDAVVSETYLGQPFSAPPSPAKLEQVRGNCDHIITQFLKNIATQVTSGTAFAIAVPAWRGSDESVTHLPLIKKIDQLGFRAVEFKNVNAKDLLYFRPDQVVAREILVLEKS